jgi:D-3-phosphoglycerate dehydrogenase
MKVLGTDTISVPGTFIAETDLRMVPLQAVLEESDFVSLHCDLNPTSFHLISRAELASMRSSAYLINTSRGPVIDEPALVAALSERRIAGAALDVFEIEPLPDDSPLRRMENCLLAPHNANSDLACRRRVHQSTIDNLLKGLLEGEGRAYE